MAAPEQLLQEAARALAGRNYRQAIECSRAALKASPSLSAGHFFLGMATLASGRAEDSLPHLQIALEAEPRNPTVINAIGNAHERLGRPEEAIAWYRRLVALAPSAAAWFNLGNACRRSGNAGDALQAYREASTRAPGNTRLLSALVRMKQSLCDWDGLDALMRRLVEQAEQADEPLDPFRFLTLETDELQQLANARRWSRQFARTTAARKAASPSERITLGYLSADFRCHAISHLTAELFELHDRRAFAVFAYSLAKDDGSAERERMLLAFDRFVDCAGLDDAAVARQIAEDGVDILIDLTGYTRGARPGIPAARPAPLQVQWLGYPGTMGAPFIDYLIADATVLPDSSRPGYDECVVRLPHSYQVNDRRRPRPRSAPSRAAFGLPERGPVLGSFNNPNKLTASVFGSWMRLLASAEDATLWLLCGDPETQANLRATAALHGLDPDQLVFAEQLPLAEHLARYRHVDLFLDTLPYGAHTTASDALWMGCPVVTRMGDAFPGRVAASLLAAVGLERYVTRSAEDYEAVALRLLRSPEERAAVKRHLEEAPLSLPLFDSPRTARALERAYEAMWARACAGLPPESFDAPAGPTGGAGRNST